MKKVFADTAYWIALFHKDDNLHQKAVGVQTKLEGAIIVTSDMVLTEFLNHFAGHGGSIRAIAVSIVERLLENPNVDVVPQTRAYFKQALELYSQRQDKGWGLTDCASFLIMNEEEIKEALAHDEHFVQAGFTALLRDDG